MPASAMISQSSARPSMRLRNIALARSNAETASNSFFFSVRRVVAAAFGAWPGTCDERDEATDWRILFAERELEEARRVVDQAGDHRIVPLHKRTEEVLRTL